MAYIKTMKDANGNIVYPQTHVRAVYTADGETLETKLNNLPTKVSELENDTGFITSTVNNLTNYYKKTETYTQDEVKDLINAITTLNIEVVTEKPIENISTTTIYLVGTDTAADNDFEEWIYTNGNWELIGTTAIDLTPYATKEYVNTAFIENQADWNETNTAAASYIRNKTHYELPYGPDLFHDMATYNEDSTSVSLPTGYGGYGGAASLVVIAQDAQGNIIQETLSRKDNTNFSIIQAKREQYGNRAYYYGNLKLGADYFSSTHTFTSTEDTGENFFLFDPGYEVSTLYLVSANSFRKVSVHNPAQATIKKLDNKYLDIANIKTSELNNDANFINEENVDAKINTIDTSKDWNQNDETAANYIENRTHYVISNEKSSEDFYAKTFSETDWVANNTIYGYQEIINDASKTLIPNCGTYLSIDYDGIEYIVEVKKFPSTWGKIVYVGNLFLLTQTEDYVADEANFFLDQIVDTKEPFLITFGTEVPK